MLCLFTFLCQSAAICLLPLEFIIISGLPMGFFLVLYTQLEKSEVRLIQLCLLLDQNGPVPFYKKLLNSYKWPPSLSLVWLLNTSVSVCLGFPALLLTYVTLAFLLVPISDTLHTLAQMSLEISPLIHPALLHVTSPKGPARTILSKVVSLSPQSYFIFPDSCYFPRVRSIFIYLNITLYRAHGTVLGIGRKGINTC